MALHESIATHQAEARQLRSYSGEFEPVGRRHYPALYYSHYLSCTRGNLPRRCFRLQWTTAAGVTSAPYFVEEEFVVVRLAFKRIYLRFLAYLAARQRRGRFRLFGRCRE
jgi:hypothetical protein